MKTIVRISLFTCLAAVGVTVHSQTNNPGQIRKIDFVTASWEQINGDFYFISGGTTQAPEYERVSISVMSRSLPYSASVGESLIFYQKSGEEYLPSTVVQIPKAGSRFLILFLPPKDDQRYIAKAIPDDRKISPFGGYAFYNITRLHVVAMLGEEKFEIAPGKTEVLELNLDRGERISYYAYAEVDGVKRWLQRNTFHFNPNKHTKFFIYQVPTTDESVKVKSKAITEFQR